MEKSKKPNVILVTSHDTGQHFSCYGDKSVRTPNFDRVASEGVLFKNNFCTAPLCSPSRGSIITGRYPISNGLLGLVNLGWSMPKEEKSLPHYFKEAGHSTHLFGFQHERMNPRESGYENIIHPQKGCFSRDVIDLLIEFIKNRKGDKPFYAGVGFSETHLPFDNPRFTPDDPEKVWLPAYIPDNPDNRLEMAQFHGLVHEVDYNVGRLMEALKEAGLEKNTIYIHTVDHGIAFPRAKSTLYNSGIKTAFIMKWLLGIPEGKVYEELVSNVDILPTLLELVGIPVPEAVQGKSLVPLLKGKKYEPREEIFAQKDWHDDYDAKRCIRTKKFKYIRNFSEGPIIPLPTDIARSLAAKSIPEKYKGLRPPEELYDLDKDPDEMNNLSEDPSYVETKKELREKLNRWMDENHDYLTGLINVTEQWR